MPTLHWLYRNTLNSVPFGIAVLVSIGLYVAVGSGFVSLREWLEMDEMLFFNWWPFKLLAVLLILNLCVVTVSRIPLTVPRYGVWTIHMGIILLVLSLSAYYTRKVEGYVPLSKGQTASDFYDRWERALYVRTQFGTSRGTVLSGLPRFNEYDESLGNAGALDRPALKDVRPQMTVIEPGTGRRQRVSLGEALGLDKPVRLDVVGYFPYGTIEKWKIDPAATGTALKIREAKSTDESTARWLVPGRAVDSVVPVGPAAIEYRRLPTQADVDVATKSAEQLHTLTIKVAGTERVDRVEPGDTLELADGYSVKVEGFTPGFALSSNDGKKADVLTVLVTKKNADGGEKTFRRTILAETNVQTDFELGVEGAGPFGKRLREGLLDSSIQLGYRFNDPTRLLSTVAETTVKYILFTADDAPGITMLRVSAREPSTVNKGGDQVDLHVTAPPAMFSAGGEHDHTDIADFNVTRVNHVAASDAVVAVPKEKRERDIASSGRGQVVRVRVSCGDFSQIVPVSYDPFAMQNQWTTPRVSIPGAKGDFQLLLGNQSRTLPVDVRLEQFEAIPYAGGDASGRSVMRDFKSTITLLPRETADGRVTGDPERTSASMNEPAFFKAPAMAWFVPGESWLFSQASWDPTNLDSTVLQVGNRPAVGTMIAACVMIFAGLMYAFYAKPLIIRRMKQNALRAAAERQIGNKTRPTNEKQLVESV